MSRRRKDSAKPKISFKYVLLVVGALFILVFSPRLVSMLSGPPDFAGPGTGTVQIEILNGDSIAKIGNNLKANGVVQSVDAFTAAAANNPDSSKIAPGFYQMLIGMSAKQAIERLLDPASKVVYKVVVPEGKRANDIFTLISTSTGIPLTDFEAIALNPVDLGLPDYADRNLEGFLFPATYEFPPGTTAASALKTMVAKFNEVATQISLIELAQGIGRTPYEILTVASIVEVEAHPNDFSKVSRVVYNRLAEPMRLQFDSTVNYGLGLTDVILTTALLNKDTPYNSYRNDGLPPTPIGNPGIAAIKAALNPAQGDWIYFITTNLDTQETKFTSSYAEFLGYKDEFLAYCDLNPETCFE